MATKSKPASNSKTSKSAISSNGRPSNAKSPAKAPAIRIKQYGIPDWRLEQPEFEVREVGDGPEIHYEIKGKLNTPVPPIRESKYLTQEQHLELYRWMV